MKRRQHSALAQVPNLKPKSHTRRMDVARTRAGTEALINTYYFLSLAAEGQVELHGGEGCRRSGNPHELALGKRVLGLKRGICLGWQMQNGLTQLLSLPLCPGPLWLLFPSPT